MRTSSFDWTMLPGRQLYFAFACILGVLSAASGMLPLVWNLGRIAEAPATAPGVVTYLHCTDHGHVDYVFEVKGSPVAAARPLVDGVACQDLHDGQRITVYYESTDPTNNYAFATGDEDGNRAMKAFWAGAAVVAGLVFVGPLFLLLVVKTFSKTSGAAAVVLACRSARSDRRSPSRNCPRRRRGVGR